MDSIIVAGVFLSLNIGIDSEALALIGSPVIDTDDSFIALARGMVSKVVSIEFALSRVTSRFTVQFHP